MIYIQKIGDEFEFAFDDRADLGLLQRCKIRRGQRLPRTTKDAGEYREWCVAADPALARTIFDKDTRRLACWHDSMAPYLPTEAMPDMIRVPETRYWHYEPRKARRVT